MPAGHVSAVASFFECESKLIKLLNGIDKLEGRMQDKMILSSGREKKVQTNYFPQRVPIFIGPYPHILPVTLPFSDHYIIDNERKLFQQRIVLYYNTKRKEVSTV